jgi:protocatechuate 3,4-dioxygenase beta subunit
MSPSPPHAAFALDHDLRALAASIQRRRALAWLAGAGVAGLTGCGGGASAAGAPTSITTTATTTATATTASTAAATCSAVAEEIAGPYPADGSNSASASGGTVDALMLSGIVRSDIRSSIAGATGNAQGVPLTVELQLVDSNAACASLAGYAVYLWHCDRDGNYSLYSAGVTNENYLRGVQTTGAAGKVSFTTIFPACYPGRMPHIHFEVYRSETTATSYTNKLRTSQIALPPDVCSTVYSTATGYAASVANLARISFATDSVFSDGVTTELATVSGSVAAGYLASLVVGIPL